MSADQDTLMELWPADHRSRMAVVIPDGGPRVSYGQLTEQIASISDVLRHGGIRAGDPVSIVLGNGLEFLVTFLATTWARAIAAPLNPGYKVEELKFYMEDAGARAV